MSIVKKIICLLLALALCFSMAGCKKTKKKQIVVIKRPVTSSSDSVENDDTSDEDTSYDNGAEYEEVYISDRELAEKEETFEDVKVEYSVKATQLQLTKDYTIVYPKGNDQLRQAAQKLSKYLLGNGIEVAVTDDTAKAKDKEILVGNTNRKKSSLAENKFAVTVSGKKLIFESGNFNGVVKAVSWFISKKFEKGKVNTLSGEYDFASTIKRPSGTYNFVWGDEFDGNALDTSKWDFSSSISAESSFKLSREPEAIKVEGGLLKLTARRWFDPDNNQIQAIAPYTVESKKHLNFQYGYLEMKARIPFGAGAWPSLWLSGACKDGAVVSNLFGNGDIISSPFSAEIDIIEYTSLETNMHKWFYDKETPDTNGGHTSLGDVMQPLKKSDIGLDIQQSYVYQTIGFDWTPEEMTVYINGQEHLKYNWKNSVQFDKYNDMSDFLNPMFIRINNHLLMKNVPSDKSTFPFEYYVDYIRLYQKSGTGGIWLAD
jgi:beta-glucanase (GH16 family)